LHASPCDIAPLFNGQELVFIARPIEVDTRKRARNGYGIHPSRGVGMGGIARYTGIRLAIPPIYRIVVRGKGERRYGYRLVVSRGFPGGDERRLGDGYGKEAAPPCNGGENDSQAGGRQFHEVYLFVRNVECFGDFVVIVQIQDAT